MVKLIKKTLEIMKEQSIVKKKNRFEQQIELLEI